jgi:predicted ATPase
MSVTAFRVKNFMAFADTGWIAIKPLTLLFGQNSSGKSTILKALMFLKQSASQSKFIYSSEDGIDVDSFTNIAHGSNKSAYLKGKKVVSFGFKFALKDDFFLGAGLAKGPLDITFDLGWNPKRNLAELIAFQIDITPKDILLEKVYFRVEIEEYTDLENSPKLIFATNIFNYSSISKTSVWANVNLRIRNGFMPSLEIDETTNSNEAQKELNGEIMHARYRDWEFIDRILNIVRDETLKFLDSLIYVRAIRPDPERLYVINDIRQEEMRRQGFSSFLNFLKGGYLKSAQETELNKWIKFLGLGQKIKVKPYKSIPGTNIISEIILTNEMGNQVNVADVGFGVSQVIPILIESLFSDTGKSLLIQQRELHLHPAAQAELADLFISMSSKTEKIFLLETHSEHLILRIMRRIKEATKTGPRKDEFPLKPDNISVIVFSKNLKLGYSSAAQVELDNEGQLITPWPGGFFEEGFKERIFEHVA